MTGLITRAAGAALVISCLFSNVAAAQAQFPDRAINAIVPFAPGGPSDIISRIVANQMAKEIGQPIVIQNRPGAGGNLGMGQVANSKPDGYTILLCSVATTQNPAVFRSMPYDPMKDLTAVAIIGESPNMIAVSAKNVPSKTLAEFIDFVKKSPGKYNIAGAGGQRMTMEKFLLTFGLQMEVVNYASGGDAANALMAGEVHLQLNSATTLAPGIQNGSVRILAIAGSQRLSAYPDIPTTAEAGFKDYQEKAYVGLYVPSGVPADAITKLHSAAMKALGSADVKTRLQQLDYVVEPMSQAEADAFYKGEVVRWKEVAKAANIPQVD